MYILTVLPCVCCQTYGLPNTEPVLPVHTGKCSVPHMHTPPPPTAHAALRAHSDTTGTAANGVRTTTTTLAACVGERTPHCAAPGEDAQAGRPNGSTCRRKHAGSRGIVPFCPPVPVLACGSIIYRLARRPVMLIILKSRTVQPHAPSGAAALITVCGSRCSPSSTSVCKRSGPGHGHAAPNPLLTPFPPAHHTRAAAAPAIASCRALHSGL